MISKIGSSNIELKL